MSRKYALFVGSSEYEAESLGNLECPIADVRDLASLFRDSEIGGFDEVLELINRPESEIRKAVGSFFLNKKREDLLLLYFSGHGILDDRGHLYLAVKDTKPDLLRATAISADFIADDMDLCRSKRQILILDCCHSGAFRRGIKGGSKALTQATFEGNGSGRIVLTASDRREFAMEGNQVLEKAQTSLFTHFLLEGIKSGEADKDGDNYISLDEWYDYAYEKVVDNLPSQTPRRWVYNQEGRLIIARNPKPRKIKPADLPNDLMASIKDHRPKIRLKAVHDLEQLLNGSNRQLAVSARTALEEMILDENPEVKKAVKKILGGDDVNSGSAAASGHSIGASSTETVEEVDAAGLMRWLQEKIVPIVTISRWKVWTLVIVVTAVVGLNWIWTALPDSNPAEGNAANPSTNQANLGDGGNLLIPPEDPDQGGENQETDPPITGGNDPPNREENSETNPGAPLEEKKDPPDDNMDTGSTDDPGGQETEVEEQQGKEPMVVDEAKNPAASEEDIGDENPKNTIEPLDRLKMDITELQEAVRRAIKERRWAGVPLPLADYYEPKLEGLYDKYDIIEVKSATDALQADENTATLPVTMEIMYQQKGRDEVQKIPVKVSWVWKKSDGGYELSEVH